MTPNGAPPGEHGPLCSAGTSPAPLDEATRRRHERLQRLLSFQPLFETEGDSKFVSGNCFNHDSGNTGKHSEITNDSSENNLLSENPLPPEIADADFLALLSEEGWLLAFDWRSWRRGETYLRHPEAIAGANGEDLRRLLTLFAGRAAIDPAFFTDSTVRHAVAATLRRMRMLHFPMKPDTTER